MVMDEGQNTVCKNDSVSSQTDTMEKAYFLVPDTVCPHLEKRPPGRIALRRRILQSRILILELQKIYRSMNKMIHVKHTESVVNSFHCKTEGVYPYQHY